MTDQSFSAYAGSYDAGFSHSAIGKMQRERVWSFLQKHTGSEKLNILELNCGTGIDARWLSEKGHRVLATDAAEGMIHKAMENNTSGNVTFKVCDIKEITLLDMKEKFDLVFSNFSGMNCLNESELRKLSDQLNSLLNQNGKMIICVFGTKCLWEKLYFFLKSDHKKMRRRGNKEKTTVIIEKTPVDTWYYSPSAFSGFFKSHFVQRDIMPVGLLIPPSYLNNFFSRKKILLRTLGFFEKLLSFSFLSDYADHYVVYYEKVAR